MALSLSAACGRSEKATPSQDPAAFSGAKTNTSPKFKTATPRNLNTTPPKTTSLKIQGSSEGNIPVSSRTLATLPPISENSGITANANLPEAVVLSTDSGEVARTEPQQNTANSYFQNAPPLGDSTQQLANTNVSLVAGSPIVTRPASNIVSNLGSVNPNPGTTITPNATTQSTQVALSPTSLRAGNLGGVTNPIPVNAVPVPSVPVTAVQPTTVLSAPLISAPLPQTSVPTVNLPQAQVLPPTTGNETTTTTAMLLSQPPPDNSLDTSTKSGTVTEAKIATAPTQAIGEVPPATTTSVMMMQATDTEAPPVMQVATAPVPTFTAGIVLPEANLLPLFIGIETGVTILEAVNTETVKVEIKPRLIDCDGKNFHRDFKGNILRLIEPSRQQLFDVEIGEGNNIAPFPATIATTAWDSTGGHLVGWSYFILSKNEAAAYPKETTRQKGWNTASFFKGPEDYCKGELLVEGSTDAAVMSYSPNLHMVNTQNALDKTQVFTNSTSPYLYLTDPNQEPALTLTPTNKSFLILP